MELIVYEGVMFSPLLSACDSEWRQHRLIGRDGFICFNSLSRQHSLQMYRLL